MPICNIGWSILSVSEGLSCTRGVFPSIFARRMPIMTGSASRTPLLTDEVLQPVLQYDVEL